MYPTPGEIQRSKHLTVTSNYTLREWMFALNLQTGNDPDRLEWAAFLLAELMEMISSRKSKSNSKAIAQPQGVSLTLNTKIPIDTH